MKLSSYWFQILWVPNIYLFYVIMSWIGCTPISELNNYIHLLAAGQDVPVVATCFSDGHMKKITFFNFPKLEDSQLLLSSLQLSLITLSILISPSTLRLLSNRIKK